MKVEPPGFTAVLVDLQGLTPLLCSGVFPQDEYPEEVSTDEDDDMFGSRKRMKRAARLARGEEEPAAGQKKASKSGGRFSRWGGSKPSAGSWTSQLWFLTNRTFVGLVLLTFLSN